jgi:hypothetical protein
MVGFTAGAIALAGKFRLAWLVLNGGGAGFGLYDHGTPAAVVGVRCSVVGRAVVAMG